MSGTKIGIVGSEQAKFTPETEMRARAIIVDLLDHDHISGVVSGGCHLGGVDIFAEEEAELLELPATIHTPQHKTWGAGYKARNLLIAQDSDEVHCITVRELPNGYKGMRFPLCYHCLKQGPGFADVPHVKSGGCWTMHQARKLGKKGVLHVI